MATTPENNLKNAKPMPAKKAAQPASGLALAMERNLFYRSAFEKVSKNIVVIGAVAVVSLALNVAQYIWRPSPVYFAIDAQNRLVPITPMTRPHVSADRVISFARDAAMSAMTYDFANYKNQLAASSKLFTHDGFTNYLSALDATGTLGRIEKEQYVSVPAPTGAGVIAEEGDAGGFYRWVVEQPALLTLQGRGGIVIPTKVTLRIVVERMDTRDRPEGMAIARLQALVV